MLDAEPVARRILFTGFRKAALDVWGQGGLDDCARRMTPEAHARCIAPLVLSEEWLPERFAVEWYLAAWEGPAQRDRRAYNGWLQRMMYLGFGTIRRTLLGFASVERVMAKTAELWRYDHSVGTMTAEFTGPRAITATLIDHPYVDTPLARASIAEILRYILALSRAGDASASHAPGPGRSVLVKLEW